MPHRIARTVFDLRTSDEASAFRARRWLETAFERDVLPALEQVLDGFDRPGALHQIGRLEVDLGSFDSDRSGPDAEQLAGRVRDTLAAALQELPPGRVRSVTPAHDLEDAFLSFLRSGTLGWPSATRSLDALEEGLLELDPGPGGRLALRVLRVLEEPGAAARLVEQFSPALVGRVVRWLQGSDPSRASARPPLEGLSRREQAAALAALARARPGPGPTDRLEASPTGAGGDIGDAGPGPTAATDEPRAGTEPERGAFELDRAGAATVTPPGKEGTATPLRVEGAGVVLLHPFLPRFFDRLGLLDQRGSRFASEEAAVRAVHLLHHLASGREHPEEPVTLLHKVLAGLPVDHPVPRWLPLEEHERAEATRLLEAVVKHWSRLGGTSPAGLREGFLRREGRLAVGPERWELEVERRSIDVLLSSLPWSLSAVALPWMRRRLHVYWA